MRAEKRWVVKPAGDAQKVAHLSRCLSIDRPLANLLFQRGVTTPEEANDFFNPQLENLLDPFLMQDMLTAVERIDRAVRREERIMIYGDYDVDGISAVSLLYNFLIKWSKELLFYIPDRYAEGYGISERGIDYAYDNGVKLIITLDCGIKANTKVKYAKERNIDFIICDHHLPGDKLPPAVAVLDPKRSDCQYPFKDLSGCGVGFKLIQAYAQYKELPFSYVEEGLDLVAISIASDIVPIIGENRILAHYGLRKLNTNPNKGLGAIIKMCGLEHHRIAIDDIIFKIGPRINAAGRMEIEIDYDDPRAQSGGRTAVRLLTAPTPERALYYVRRIDEFNKDRKSIDRNITQEAHNFIAGREEFRNTKSTVIYNPNWMKGVVGIVASRLIETYFRPTVVLTLSNGMVTGSARSVPGFDLYQAVESCSDLLENFGGHTYAAGLTMRPENLDEFRRRFEKFVVDNINPEETIQYVEIDMELDLNEITPSFRQTLTRFEPFGPGNPSPIFLTREAVDNGTARLVGAKNEHLKMELLQPKESRYSTISAIAFSQTSHYEHVRGNGAIDVCYTVVDNNFQGMISPQLRVKDVRPSEQGE
ncbi:Single-stranded-DNA-specific exonuclease RecJ [Mucinivorans hirudinis]|uniref:Single-stranded-DNA-specific exonuclease RecJ n=1 Tax=Mucinivorans hirudinis TaxID=1433126 RepID=A0A060RE76_9BACT|nr:Single-stranded-DNA-specific exonuclease RecJ [Mucinivorans hirudinis]